ncbi:ABC transporter ATP-binding protein [Desulforamulus ruminis]|uniref:ABC transporter ATP-binding protein n=1 Tax=Desulforamulus ruminis TaxID=1564 RepID=UPI002FD9DC8C
MSTENNILEVRSINKSYGNFSAVNGISFQIPRGEIFTLLGHNGAGKSTLIKMILGLVSPDAGELVIDGCTYEQNLLKIKRKVGYLPERMNFYDNLTAWETLQFYAQIKGLGKERCKEVLEEVGLKEAMHKRVGTYSKGMQQRLGLAQAIIHRPQLLILDEPTTGLDPSGVWWLKKMIRDWNRSGTTVLFSSHNLDDVEELAHRVAILCRGQMVAAGTIRQLQDQYHLKVTLQVELAEQLAAHGLRLLLDSGLHCVKGEQNRLIVTCNLHEKGKVLEGLLAKGIRFTDFKVEEPGLDVIYQEVIRQKDLPA